MRDSGGFTRRDGALDRALEAPEDAPLGRLLDDEFEERRGARMWRAIEQRGAQRATRAWRALGLAAAAVCVMLLAVFWFGSAPSAGPLTLTSGATPSAFVGTADATPLALDDGSRIQLANGSRLEVLRNDGRSFVTVLRRGESTFDVKPGGPRRWIVEAGLASVQVIGTRFRVIRAADSMRVEVERGSVLVVGESVPGGSRRLPAGRSLEIRAAEARGPAASGTPGTPPIAPVPALVGSSAATGAPSLPAPVAAPPRAVAAHAGTAPPAASSGSVGASAQAAPDAVDTLLAAADGARRAGDVASAMRHLEEVVRVAGTNDRRRGMAALSLARLALRSDPARAARALDVSMSSMPRSLAEDALARLVEAEARAGRAEQAAELAREYLRRFPTGHRADEVKRWTSP